MQLSYLLKEVLKVVADTFPNAITVESSLERGLRVVKGNGSQLRQAFLAPCTNARDAMPEGGGGHGALLELAVVAPRCLTLLVQAVWFLSHSPIRKIKEGSTYQLRDGLGNR